MVERRKFGGNLTEQEVLMDRFESVFDHFDVKYAEIEECNDYENEMDGLDRIEMMRERVEARCDEYYDNVSRDEKVKLIVEIIEDVLALEYELDSCKNKKDLDNVEQDDLEIIWEKIGRIIIHGVR